METVKKIKKNKKRRKIGKKIMIKIFISKNVQSIFEKYVCKKKSFLQVLFKLAGWLEKEVLLFLAV